MAAKAPAFLLLALVLAGATAQDPRPPADPPAPAPVDPAGQGNVPATAPGQGNPPATNPPANQPAQDPVRPTPPAGTAPTAPGPTAPNPTAPNPTAPAPTGPNRQTPGGRPGPGAPTTPPGGAAPAGQETPKEFMTVEGDDFVFEFDETEGIPLKHFIKNCEQVTGIPFYVKREVNAKIDSIKVMMIGKKRVPRAKLYDFFQSIMKINDLVMVLEGSPETGIAVISDIKGPERTQIRSQARYIAPEEIPAYSTQPATLVTTVIQIEHTQAREISASLRPFFPDSGLETVTNVGNANALLVTGFGPTVFSISNLLKLIDTPPDEPKKLFEVIELQHASADEVAQILDELIEKRRGAAGAPQQGVTGTALQGQQLELKIKVDGSSNSLLVVGLDEDVRQVLEIVARIDKPQPEPESDFHVYVLRNVKADELATTIQDFITQSFQQATQAGAGAGAGGRAPGAAAPSGSPTREARPVVKADKVSNSLLVTATKTRWLEVRDLIERLDRRQAQVLLETALIELTTNDAIALGVELGFVSLPPAGSDVSKGFGITNFGLSTLIDTDNDNFPDTRVPNSSLQGVTGGILSGPDFGIPVLLQALRTRSDSNVLSIPSVLVNNNERALVSSKDQIPTAQTTNTANIGSQTSFSGYQEAGITLEITPSISAQNYLRLDLSLRVSNFTAAQGANPTIPPPKTERELKTTVYLPNESTMVIGGIQVDNTLKSKSSIPLLGDIPILSWLFSSHSDTNTKRSLYFFVTPHILSDVEFADLQNLSYQRKLDARAYIGDERMRIVDPQFRPIQPGAGPGSAPSYDSGIFEIPLYRSPRAGEVAPAEIGVTPTSTPQETAPPPPEKPGSIGSDG